MQKPLFAVRADKLPCLKGLSIGSRKETCANWGGPIPMVPCLHLGNIYIKKKLRLWIDQKCIPLLCVKTPLTYADHQATPSKGTQYRAVKLLCLKRVGIGPRTETTVNWGGPIPMVPCLHLGNIDVKRKLRLWIDQKCIPLLCVKTPLTYADHQTTPSKGTQYRAENANMRKLGWTYHHGTVFAP